MNEHNAGLESTGSANLEHRVQRLANERSVLFDRAHIGFGLSKADSERLRSVEQELDECFLERRRTRAARDAQRFDPLARLTRPVRRPSIHT